MSLISEISECGPPITKNSWDRKEYPSLDQSWLAVLDDPIDWHMCATGWRLSVTSSKTQTKIINSDIDEIYKGKGFKVPRDYVPWSADSQILALCSWDNGLLFYNPQINCLKMIDVFPHALQWSPTENYLLIFINGQILILNEMGEIINRINWVTANFELPRIGWMPSGSQFFVIGRTSKRAKPRIALIDAEKAEIISNELLDPLKLLPYNSQEYKKIPRGEYSLKLPVYSRIVGYLLDTWCEVVYDLEKCSLFMSVFRPTSPVIEEKGKHVCQVEEKWVAVKINS